MNLRLPLLTAALALLGACAAPQPAPDIDAQVKRLMARDNVQGLALATIDHGAVTRVAAYGRRNATQSLTADTIMYGASLTKTAFAYLLLQLADEGRLDLDASIAQLLPRPLPSYRGKDFDFGDLEGDERWRQLTPRILLNHASGFANFRWLEPDKKLRFHFAPGGRYAYSGEGFYILQLVLEQGLGLDTESEMQRRVFDRFGMRSTSMRWREDFAANLADGFAADGSMAPHDQRSRVRAAGSMDTTIADQARLWAGIVRGDGLSAGARAAMVAPAFPITSLQQFPTLAQAVNPDNARVGLAAGLGVVSFRDRAGLAWFKGGHNDTTANLVICQEHQQRCVVMLSNDVRAERLYPDLARLVLGPNNMPWRWEYGAEAGESKTAK
jgi:CubicO group peptidase (beta-lactamase class C family)